MPDFWDIYLTCDDHDGFIPFFTYSYSADDAISIALKVYGSGYRVVSCSLHSLKFDKSEV